MPTIRRSLLALAVAAAFAAGLPSSAGAQDFYRGKTVSLVVPFPAGGTFDILARLVARHLPRFIPGNPTMIVENVPGGGGLIGARAVFRAPPDGLKLLHTASIAMIGEVVGEPTDAPFSKFTWLGSVSGATYIVMLRAEFADKLEELKKSQAPIKFGINAPGGLINETTKFFKHLGGLNVQLIPGYAGGNPLFLAFRQGEVDGMVGGAEAVTSHPLVKEMYQTKMLKPVMLFGGSPPGKETEAVVAGLPSLRDTLSNPVDRQALDALNGLVSISRIFMATPGIPADRAEILRKAFADMLGDAQFGTELSGQGFPLDPVRAAEMDRILNPIFGLSPAARARVVELLK